METMKMKIEDVFRPCYMELQDTKSCPPQPAAGSFLL
jgi:hypothetical protein